MFAAGLLAIPFLATAADKGSGTSQGDAIHAEPWAFGQSPDRQAPLWHKGVNAESISRHSRPQAVQKGKATDTSGGIDRALKTAEEKNRKNSIGLSIRNETTTWKSVPGQKIIKPDEVKARDSSHVLGAYADVEAAEDLSIRIGPEIILKDEGASEGLANSSQPDSALGMGMNFKLDF